MRQFVCGKRGERRVLTNAEKQNRKMRDEKLLEDIKASEIEKERLVAEGKLRKVVIREGGCVSYRYEEI